MKIIFSPRLDGRTYAVKASPSLAAGSWNPLSSNPPTADNGTERTVTGLNVTGLNVTDLNATGTKKFYRVEIQK